MTEGTYPYVRGGVSTWCHELVCGLPEIEFVVFALTGEPSGRVEYALPPNVSRLISVPLYGHGGLREYNGRDLGGGPRRRSSPALRERAVPLFQTLLRQVMLGMERAAPEELLDAIVGLYGYFREHDYDWTMRQPEIWETAIAHFRAQQWHARFMSSLEAIELVRALYRYLLPLAIEVPDCDVVHSSVSGLCGTTAVVAKRALGIPVLLTEHGIYLRERVLELARSGIPFSDRAVKKNLFSSIARATYSVSDVIAPVCSYNTQWERFYGVPAGRIEVVYNGVDQARFDDRDRSPDVPTVCAVIRIDPLKDVPTLISSATTVRKKIPNVRYKIWGPAPDREYEGLCKRLIRELGLEATVELMGPTSDAASAYANSHVVALSSISEGFPYSVIEAMMCAKPVVATDVGGVREAVDRFGVVVPPKRPERLGAAIAELLAEPTRARELGKRARAFALERFTQARFLGNYRELYERLAYARAPAPATEALAG
ncbi:MAG: GT4 family glycosyltransferase PelF [Vulcanimicrobiaceae bacterium]